LKPEIFINFLAGKTDDDLVFVNDGSRDNTTQVLRKIEESAKSNVTVLQLTKNKGKATAIREGILSSIDKNSYSHIGYLDADLSTDLDEFYSMFLEMQQRSVDYIFGSRIRMLNTKIERSLFRHLSGRLIATIIDSRYRLGIYDTQCGSKCFSTDLIKNICGDPFKTKWFFDVEIFLRIRKNNFSGKGIEFPLQKWKNPGGSKINILKLPAIIKDIYLLFKNYSKK
ncbi:MAG TPA: glycosyltransferase, partial [Chitinophagaceae bacterium]|nr:glycosyltransferase [Chitinophagaceae bacterium]